jgi:hypothetical protein
MNRKTVKSALWKLPVLSGALALAISLFTFSSSLAQSSGMGDQGGNNYYNPAPGQNSFQNDVLNRLDQDPQFRQYFVDRLINDDNFRMQLMSSVSQQGMLGRAFADSFENDPQFRSDFLDRFQNDAQLRHSVLQQMDQWISSPNNQNSL